METTTTCGVFASAGEEELQLAIDLQIVASDVSALAVHHVNEETAALHVNEETAALQVATKGQAQTTPRVCPLDETGESSQSMLRPSPSPGSSRSQTPRFGASVVNSWSAT